MTGVVHSVKRLATCNDCGLFWSSPYASACAARHAANHGHTVKGMVLVERIYTAETAREAL